MASTRLDGAPSPNGHVAVEESGAGESDSNLLGRAVRGLAGQVTRRIPRADLDERDPDFIRERLPLM